MEFNVLLCFLGINLFLCCLHLCNLGNHRVFVMPSRNEPTLRRIYACNYVANNAYVLNT